MFRWALQICLVVVVLVKNKMVPMGDYFYEIALEDFEFVNLIARTS